MLAQKILRKATRFVRYSRIYRRYKAFTMVPPTIYIANLELMRRYSGIKGAIVECGTWKGGMIAGATEVLGKDRAYFLFDSFEGLPEAQEIDGEGALRWQADKAGPTYYDNCTASERDAAKAMGLAGVKADITKGWFRDTLPGRQFPDGIAILRLDADWYEPTSEILDNLFDYVTSGGILIVDDYYTWDGCSRAVHDYLARNRCTERIQTYQDVCFIVKQ